jgi:hypothetical protein
VKKLLIAGLILAASPAAYALDGNDPLPEPCLHGCPSVDHEPKCRLDLNEQDNWLHWRVTCGDHHESGIYGIGGNKAGAYTEADNWCKRSEIDGVERVDETTFLIRITCGTHKETLSLQFIEEDYTLHLRNTESN